jgi:hypothetical protein
MNSAIAALLGGGMETLECPSRRSLRGDFDEHNFRRNAEPDRPPGTTEATGHNQMPAFFQKVPI